MPSNPGPSQTQADLLEALALHQRGQLQEAQKRYDEILRMQPHNHDALHLLGLLESQAGHHQRAVDLIGQAIAISPANAVFHSNLGISLQDLKQLPAAIASFERAIAINPGLAEAHYNRGNALQELQELEAAVASYDHALAINPDYAKAHSNRGNALQQLKQYDAAVASYDRAVAINPAHARAWSNRGNALQELKQFEAAIASYDRAIAINPDYAEAYYNRGNALRELQQPDAAIADYERAIAIQPASADTWSNRGLMLHALNQVDDAIASYDRAITLSPTHAEAHFNRALALLLNGDFANGWPAYEWRWTDAKHFRPRSLPQPLWLGNESLAGKSILLHSEQGIGDTIQFCRYAKLAADMGARVLLEVEKPLLGLLKGLEGVSEVIEKGAALPDFDYHCPLLSLPMAFKTSLDSIPCAQKYLAVDAGRQQHWSVKLGGKAKPRVGLVWGGNPLHRNDKNRSVSLAALLPHLPAGVQYVAMQKEIREEEKTLLDGAGILRFDNDLADLQDTAALCDLMDLVVSVDTGVAHLNAALGKPTWILLPFCPDWRWLLGRDDSPWYPGVTLYRQARAGDWDSVFDKVRAGLNKLMTVA
jgi:tetratricopeptide (TPR) repeat protein